MKKIILVFIALVLLIGCTPAKSQEEKDKEVIIQVVDSLVENDWVTGESENFFMLFINEIDAYSITLEKESKYFTSFRMGDSNSIIVSYDWQADTVNIMSIDGSTSSTLICEYRGGSTTCTLDGVNVSDAELMASAESLVQTTKDLFSQMMVEYGIEVDNLNLPYDYGTVHQENSTK